jgi:hypothetical protein
MCSWCLLVLMDVLCCVSCAVQVLTCQPLPSAEPEFFELLNLYFPCVFDIKYLMKFCDNLHGGLNKLAELLDVQVSVGGEPGRRRWDGPMRWMVVHVRLSACKVARSQTATKSPAGPVSPV